jgi:catechol 2,3-dioxygenase-like lactoylglutathione lyase family enzyme
VKVATDDGWMLEVVQWETPKRYEGHQLIMYDYPGLNHICFRVASVEVFHRALEVSGYKPTDIQTDPPGGVMTKRQKWWVIWTPIWIAAFFAGPVIFPLIPSPGWGLVAVIVCLLLLCLIGNVLQAGIERER